MERLKPNPILEFNPNQMENVRKPFGYDDINRLQYDLDELKKWIKEQNHFKVKKFDDGFLERFLIYNKGSTGRAKMRLEKFCSYNTVMPEYLQNFDIKNEFVHLRNMFNVCVLPKPTPDNYRVIMCQFRPDPAAVDRDGWTLIQYVRYMIVMCEYMMHNDYCFGYEFVSDLTDMPLSIITKINPFVLHKSRILIVETLGQRMKKIHMIGASKAFKIVINIVKQTLSAKLAQRLTAHSDLESFYEHMPKEMLPKDYGGNESTLQQLSEENFKELSSNEHIEHVKYLERAKTDESLRSTCRLNEDYPQPPVSLQTLCVD